MPVDKLFNSPQEALACLSDGQVIGVSGFEGQGEPIALLRELSKMNIQKLTLLFDFPTSISSEGASVLYDLCLSGRVQEVITCNRASEYVGVSSELVDKVKLTFVERNLLAEQLRVIGAGLGSVEFVRPSENAMRYEGIRLDVALIKGFQSDHLGNTVYQGTSRNWSPVMAMAARITIAESDSYVEPGVIDPEGIITPGIYINRIVCVNS